MSGEKSFIEKLNALKEKNSAERAKKKVRLPDATNMKRQGDKIALDFYMEALYNMSAEDIQRLDSCQWERMFETIRRLSTIDGVGEKVEKHLDEKINKKQKQKEALELIIANLKKKEIELKVKKQKDKENEEKGSAEIDKELDRVKEQIEKEEKKREEVKKEISKLYDEKEILTKDIAKSGEGYIYTVDLFEYYPDVFVKLYSNYRFSKDVYEYLTKMGTAIGEMLANDTKLNTSAIALNLGEHRKESANEISKNMLDLLYPGARDCGIIPTPVNVRTMGDNGATYARKIDLCDRVYGNVLGTIIHECLHSYAQSKPNSDSGEMYFKGILPFVSDTEGVSKEIKSFMWLLIKNSYNYVSTSRYEYRIPGALYHAYKKQPVERHSRFVATIAMQVYKEKTNYQRPNNSIDIYNHLKGRFGEPSFVEPYYEDKNKKVRFGYEVDEKVTKDAIEKAMQLTVEFKKVDLSKELGLKIEEQTIDDKKFVVFDVPETWEARSKIIPFMRMKNRQNVYANIAASRQSNKAT